MQSVPQFVLKRLKETAAVAGPHPDADLLTAFAEQSLAGDERARVMEHLARCGDCRDVVAIALPATEVAALPVSVSHGQFGWLRWPALRWAALAAGILAVTSVGVVQFSHRNQQKTVASSRMQEAVAAPPALSQPSSPQATAPQMRMQKKTLAALESPTSAAHDSDFDARREDQPRSSSRFVGAMHGEVVGGVGGGAGGGMGIGGRISPNRSAAPQVSKRLIAAPAPVAPAPQNPSTGADQQLKVGSASEVVEVQAANGSINTESAVISQNQVAQNPSNLPLQGRQFADLDVVKAKDPVPGQAAAGAVSAPALVSPGPLQTAPSLMLRASPRWTVSSSGVLQRSFDGGNTWENVNPAPMGTTIGALVAKTNGAQADAAGYEHAKQDKAKQSYEAKSASNPALVFRAVAASGLEVWAGGSGGVLYHTSDGGNRWSRVTPSTATAALTGDVIGIQFSDTLHGTISTSTAELWSTSDGGQSWRRQQ